MPRSSFRNHMDTYQISGQHEPQAVLSEDLLPTIARNVARLVSSFAFKDAVVVLRLSSCHVQLLESDLVSLRCLIAKFGSLGSNALFPESTEDFEWYHGGTNSSFVPPELTDPMWTTPALGKADYKTAFGLSRLLLQLEMQIRILRGDKDLVILTQDDFNDFHRKATNLGMIGYFSVLRRIMTYVHNIGDSLHYAQRSLGLRVATTSGDTSLLKAILTNNYADCNMDQSRLSSVMDACAFRLRKETSVHAQDQSLIGWKEVVMGSKQWPTSGIQTPSFLGLLMRQPSYSGRVWSKYLDLVARVGDPHDLQHAWLRWNEVYQNAQHEKNLRAKLSKEYPSIYPMALERKLQFQTRERVPMAQALTKRTCNRLTSRGASHEAWEIATDADQTLVSLLNHSTYEALLDYGRFDMDRGPFKIWRIFQKQIESYETGLGIRWISDGVTGKHVLEGEWADFDFLLQNADGLDGEGSVSTIHPQTEESNQE